MTSDSDPVLVCTLGGKAQILTFVLDALLQKNIAIRKVIVIHHAPPQNNHRLRQALRIVSDQKLTYYKNQFSLQEIAIRDKRGIITDLDESVALSAVWETMSQAVSDLKQQHREIHFCFTGGRRLLAMQGMAVLSLHATPSDYLWQLFTPPLLQEDAGTNLILHANEREDLPQPHLVRVPLVPWAYFFKGLRELLQLNPEDAIRLSANVLDEREEQHCVRVWTHLSPRKRELFRLIIEGKSPQEASVVMHLAHETIANYLQDIRGECRTEWGLGTERISYDWLRHHFAPYLPKLITLSE